MSTLSLDELEKQSKLSELLDKALKDVGIIGLGDAVISGRKVKVINVSDRYIWFLIGKKEFRMPRRFLTGVCKQGGNYVV